MLNSIIKNKQKKNVFWWEPKDGSHNAGDHLGKVIVQSVLSTRDFEIFGKRSSRNTLFSIGSVMHFAKNGDCIWGTGINGKIDKSKLKFKSLDVRAVRGPNTRDFLKKEKGIIAPEVFGDPGLLLPLFYSKELLTDDQLKKDFIVIPHMNEDFNLYAKYKQNICSPNQGAIGFTKEIVNSKFVISSSLHGVILAEAYGIPAVFLSANSGESQFKYDDYYFGTGRNTYARAVTVEEAFDLRTDAILDLQSIQSGLLKAFPFDLW